MILKMFANGAITTGFLVAAVFFLRFHRDTRDKFFLWFAGAFALLGAERIVIASLGGRDVSETAPSVYQIRCVAFLMICVAVINKNRAGKASNSD